MGLFDKFLKKKTIKEELGAEQQSEDLEVKKELKEEKVEAKKDNSPKKVGQKREGTLAYKILVKPLLTEKMSDLGAQRKYAFCVNKGANKIEIARAVEDVYGVKPIKINVINILGKKVRYGKTSGRTKNWKKAIITLKEGDKIEAFEGV